GEEMGREAGGLGEGIRSVGFGLQGRRRVNVWRDALERMGLPVGPWLNEAKRAVRRGDPDDSVVAVDPERTVTLGELRKEALQVAPGQRLAYLVDLAAHEENVERAVRPARGADHLFIEAPFADEDAALAQQRRHLTAGASGRIARRAGVRQVIPFHFSPRYADRPDLLREQVERAFRE